MTLKGRAARMFLFTTFFALDISLVFQFILPSPAGTVHERYADMPRVSTPVAVDTTDIVQQVRVEEVFDLQVIQQPSGKSNYVSPNNDELTQFAAVSPYGNIGLLAHNYLAGKWISRLKVGQEVQVVFEGGKTEQFVIARILRFQALEPESPYSSFQNTSNVSDILSADQMFNRAYRGEHHLTFQTCIAKNGISSWGRLFVVAMPKVEQPVNSNPGLLTSINLSVR